MDDQPYLFTVKEASKRLGIQYRQLLDAVNAGMIPYYQIGKSRRMVSLSEVLVFIKHQPKE